MSRVLEQLAWEVGASERTLRRAVNEGTIRAGRPSPYALELPVAERRYLRSHWPLIAQLRGLLRTEPNLMSAILFGSAARGDDTSDSDVDIAVWLRSDDATARFALRRRLETRIGCPVQIVDGERIREQPTLLESLLPDGRMPVDRGGLWPQLRASLPRIRRDARRRRRELAEHAQRARQRLAARDAR